MSRGVYWVWEEHLCNALICEMLISLLSFLFDLQFVFSMMQRFHHLSFATVVCWLILFFVDWNFFSRPVASPRMFFFVSSPLKGEVSLFFETFYFCELVAYPIIISLFTFRVPSVWDHFFCVSMSTTRTSPLLIFSLSFTMSSDFIIFCILAELFVKHWFVFENLCFKLLKA